VVTIFGARAQLHKSGIKWSFVPAALGLSLMGWIIGGFIAVVDSTIVVNNYFHNTMWVTSHFHTYFLMGFVLMFLAFVYNYFQCEIERPARSSLLLILLGGYGVILAFAIAGIYSVPRRYASYSDIPFAGLVKSGESTAVMASMAALLLITGVLIFYKNIIASVKNRW
jgi:cytochrome c oxidase subunit 1